MDWGGKKAIEQRLRKVHSSRDHFQEVAPRVFTLETLRGRDRMQGNQQDIRENKFPARSAEIDGGAIAATPCKYPSMGAGEHEDIVRCNWQQTNKA